eukprot:7388278-Prymnesium_polylepis.1
MAGPGGLCSIAPVRCCGSCDSASARGAVSMFRKMDGVAAPEQAESRPFLLRPKTTAHGSKPRASRRHRYHLVGRGAGRHTAHRTQRSAHTANAETRPVWSWGRRRGQGCRGTVQS